MVAEKGCTNNNAKMAYIFDLGRSVGTRICKAWNVWTWSYSRALNVIIDLSKL